MKYRPLAEAGVSVLMFRIRVRGFLGPRVPMTPLLAFALGWHPSPDMEPTEWIPATAPGAVQLDWARAQGWPAWWYGDEWKRYRWMEDVWWTYRTSFAAPPLGPGERLRLILGGIDHAGEVRLNGVKLAERTGSQTPLAVDLTDHLREENELRITIQPVPKSRATPENRTQADATTKAAVSYTWDFHPRLIPLGLWREAGLEVLSVDGIETAEVDCVVAPDLASASLALVVRTRGAGANRLRWRVADPRGATVIERLLLTSSTESQAEAALVAPVLWWPHDQGEPALYRWEVELVDAAGVALDRRGGRFGARRVALVIHEGGWAGATRSPQTRNHPPITLEVNGRRLFAKGTNWVSPHAFPGSITDEAYRDQLGLAKIAGFSLLRTWGGAPAPREFFFELCDELGLMVWQEFPLGCNCYAETPAYLAELEQEARSLIARLRPHPSMVMWCGGNELFNNWSRMTDQAPALRLLASLCWQLDPARPFLPTSPVDGVAHGPYSFRDHVGGGEIWSIFQSSANTAYPEFGCTSPTIADIAHAVLPEAERWPPRTGTAWDAHTGFEPGSFGHQTLATIEAYLGPVNSLAEFETKGQLLQFEGVRGLYEEARRQKPRAAMALTWCFNEPWPTLANCSLLAWPDRPKRGYHGAKLACRPVLASARIRKFAWAGGESFDPQLWLLNDAPQSVPAGRMTAMLVLHGERTLLGSWDFPEVAANTNLVGPTLALALPAGPPGLFELELFVEERPALASTYTLCFAPPDPAMLDVRGPAERRDQPK